MLKHRILIPLLAVLLMQALQKRKMTSLLC